MLKIIKYDLKSIGITTAIFGLAAIIINAVFIIMLSQSASLDSLRIEERFNDGCMVNIICYIAFVFAVAGNMWKRTGCDTELYEMAGVSPLKVGAARCLIVFAAVTAFAYLLTLGESIMYKAFVKSLDDYGYGMLIVNNRLRYVTDYANSMFAINGLKWTNIFAPVFAGLNITILFTTSFLFATLTRRFNNKLASGLVLGAIVILAVVLNFAVLNKINIYIPELNLNKLGVGGLIIERFGRGFGGSEYGNLPYLINPNLLNMGLLLFQVLYVALMFSVYSIRRKAV